MSSRRSLKSKLTFIYRELFKLYGEPGCPLRHDSPFQLLAATMLSAQCTDRRVNLVTKELFKKWPDAKSLSQAEPPEVEPYIEAAGLFRVKAANLVAAARKIMRDFDGEVPAAMDELATLPGVGRKTANVVLGNAFGIPGFPVDTHVRRLAARLGIAELKTPAKIEAIVCANIAARFWTNFSHLLIAHGRLVCNARKPLCGQCPLTAECEYCQREHAA